MNTQTEKFCELLREFDTAVLVTHGTETHYHVRPMALACVEDNGNLWFITREDSAKVREIEQDSRAQVICQKGWTSCVSVAGHANLVRDPEKIRELWKASYKVWFPRGADDPNIVLIHFIGEQGEYWDNTGLNRLRYVFEAFKAVTRGTTPDIREGEQHGNVTLRG